MLIRKSTTGWVEQTFDTDKQKFVSQKFHATDGSEYLTSVGVVDLATLGMDYIAEEYLPYDMVQPRVIKDSMPITWREVLTALHELTDDQLDMTASVWDSELGAVVSIFDTFLEI